MSRTPTNEAIVEALTRTFGNVSESARKIGMAPSSLRRRIAKSETLQDAKLEARNLFLDSLEEVSRQETLKPENTIERIFTLKTVGKQRGYVERQEIVQYDPTKLTDEQLDRIISGESPATVVRG